MANGLKNYATVNTAEPIPTQLPYNIGTENIENGKAGETLNDTQMELEENSIITEIEDVDINLYDMASQTSNNFDVDMFDNVFNDDKNKKVNIISVKKLPPPETNLVNLDKQIYTPEALQMSLACDEEVPSMWVDVMNYYNSSQANVFEQNTIDDNQIIAVPTAVQSYVNLPPHQTSDSPLDTYNQLNNFIMQNLEQTTNTDANLLKNLTAEVEICKCVDCKCDSVNNCQNCEGHEFVHEGQSQINCCNKPVKNLGCGGDKNDCCVVVCLKTLDQLRQILNMANSCGGLQNLMLACIKGGEFCAVQK